VRGQRFFERREVRDARQLLRRSHPSATGPALAGEARSLFERRLGLGAGGDQAGPEARERSAALELLLGVIADLASAQPDLGWETVSAELDRRDAEEAAGSANGVNLLTYHRAKGLEWDAVFLPALEEGLLPIRQAKDAEAVAEERRLLYVGITRARFHLALSWAQSRTAPGGKAGRREPSRFLADLDARPQSDLRQGHGRGRPTQDRAASRAGVAAILAQAGAQGPAPAADRRCLEALQRWRRERARADGVPAYVVAPDATLVAIAEARPRTEHALAGVRGIGPARLEQYGAEILEIVARES
jgi:DNA helicase II / ATP-dependent DNA helicase PcrA